MLSGVEVAPSAARPLDPPRVAADPDGLATLVRWAAALPLRVRADAAGVRAGYCSRSPSRIAAEGTLIYTAPCADLSSLVAVGLEASGLRPTLVLTGIARPLQPVKFQSGLEVDLDGATWVVGFGIAATYLYAGRFVETPRRPLVFRARPEGRLDPDVPFLEHFEPDGRAGVARRVAGYDLERDLRDHARRQGRLRFAWTRRKARSAARARRPGRLADAGGRWAE